MYPDLSYIFHALLGTEPDNWLSLFKTFGLFLLFAFLSAAFLLRRDLVRRQNLGQLTGEVVLADPRTTTTVWDYILNGLIGFFIGFKLPYGLANLDVWKSDPGSVLLGTDGWWWTGLLLGAAFVAYHVFQARAEPISEQQRFTIMPSDRVGPITMIAALGGIIGAKVFAIVEYLPTFFEDPLGVLFSGNGLAIYGGLIGGAVAVMLYARKHGIGILPLADAVAPGLFVAYGVGRMGCQFSGDGDWGIVAGRQPNWWIFPDWAWSSTFPRNVINEGVRMADCSYEYCNQLPAAVYPTSIYETVMAFAMGAVLWSLRKRLTYLPGTLFSLYLVLNGLERFCIEFIRVNDRYAWAFNLSQAQLIAIGFILVGVVLGLVCHQLARPRVQT